MEAVNVFSGVDGHQHFFCVDMRRQWQLHQNAVNFVAVVEVMNQSEQCSSRRSFGRRVLLAVDADFLGGFDLTANVDLRRRVVTDEDNCQARTNSEGGHGLHFRSHFGADVVSDSGAVENSGGHSDSGPKHSASARKSYTAEVAGESRSDPRKRKKPSSRSDRRLRDEPILSTMPS